MALSTFILYSHHHPSPYRFYSFRLKLCQFSLLQSLGKHHFFSVFLIIVGTTIMATIQYLSFCIWLYFLMHVMAWIRILFYFSKSWIIILHSVFTQFCYPFIHGRTSTFWLWIMQLWTWPTDIFKLLIFIFLGLSLVSWACWARDLPPSYVLSLSIFMCVTRSGIAGSHGKTVSFCIRVSNTQKFQFLYIFDSSLIFCFWMTAILTHWSSIVVFSSLF